MKIHYAAPYYDQDEIAAVVRTLENPRHLGAGPAVEAFERKVAECFEHTHGLMVNSGSSANLLALAALDLPPGSEVITPALTFGTTVAPILQLGLTPVFVDTEPGTYVTTPEAVEKSVTDRTSAVMIPLLLGNIPDMVGLRRVCDEHGLAFVEDSCDTLGGWHRARKTGYWADVTTTSFYATHIITCAGGGGMLCTRDERVAERARLLAYWGRSSSLFGHGEDSEDMDLRLDGAYDAKFWFTASGYNMQPLELQAAFGLEQLKRLGPFRAIRRARWGRLRRRVAAWPELHTAHVPAGSDPVWLAFPLEVAEDAPFTREDLARHLEAAGVQTRPIMAGNVLRHPGFRGLADPGAFPVADSVMRNGLLLGCHQGMTRADVDYIADAIDGFMDR